MNARLVHGHQYTRFHTTSSPSAPSIPQGISSISPIVQYQGGRASRDRPQKSQKMGNLPEKPSSRSSRRPAGISGTLEGQYPCDICGKRFAQRQGVSRHYRAAHGHPNMCSYCDFKWSRPYLYKAHLKTKHRDVVSDTAQEEATSTRHRAADTSISPQQQPVFILTPEHNQRGGTEAWWYPITQLASAVVEVTPIRSSAYNVLIIVRSPIPQSLP